MPVFFWKLAAGAFASWVAYEQLIDGPDQTIIHDYGPSWKEYAVLGLAAAGGYYLATRAAK